MDAYVSWHLPKSVSYYACHASDHNHAHFTKPQIEAVWFNSLNSSLSQPTFLFINLQLNYSNLLKVNVPWGDANPPFPLSSKATCNNSNRHWAKLFMIYWMPTNWHFSLMLSLIDLNNVSLQLWFKTLGIKAWTIYVLTKSYPSFLPSHRNYFSEPSGFQPIFSLHIPQWGQFDAVRTVESL